MLTKDLIRFKVKKGFIQPSFLDPEAAQIQEAAELMVSVFEGCEGQTREELQTNAQRVRDQLPGEVVVNRGFEKLLMDRVDFLTPDDEVLPTFRDKLFHLAGTLIHNRNYQSFEHFEHQIEASFGESAPNLRQRLFSDLPLCHPVQRFRSIEPKMLIHRYNCAQVQWLLLHANSLVIDLPHSETASIRQLIKYMRFQQLLAQIESIDEKGCHLIVSGPLNLFFQTKRYGINLGRFFPALLHQPKWSLFAELQIRKKPVALKLDQNCTILPVSHRFHAFIPKEVELFLGNLREKAPNWDIETGSAFLRLPGEHYCFPDFSLIHSQKKIKIHIELFHAWHQAHLIQRLKQVSLLDTVPLIIGIDHRLSRQADIKATIARSSYFSEYGFSFREIPSAQKVLPLLKKAATRA